MEQQIQTRSVERLYDTSENDIIIVMDPSEHSHPHIGQTEKGTWFVMVSGRTVPVRFRPLTATERGRAILRGAPNLARIDLEEPGTEALVRRYLHRYGGDEATALKGLDQAATYNAARLSQSERERLLENLHRTLSSIKWAVERRYQPTSTYLAYARSRVNALRSEAKRLRGSCP